MKNNVKFNKLKVGRETINSSDDALLKQDMPSSLRRVEDASHLLEDASVMLNGDPYSSTARYLNLKINYFSNKKKSFFRLVTSSKANEMYIFFLGL